MNRTSLPTLIGVFSSLLVIWVLHNILIVDDCASHGGEYTYETSQCMLAHGELYESALTNVIIILYFFVGFAVSFLVSTLIKKVMTKNK